MTAPRSWMNSTLLLLAGAGLLFTIGGLIRQPDGIAAGLAVTTVLTVLAGSLLRTSAAISRNILITAPAAVLAGAFVASVGGHSGSIALGLCSATIAGAGMILIGLATSKWLSASGILLATETTTNVAASQTPAVSVTVSLDEEVDQPSWESSPEVRWETSQTALDLISADDLEEPEDEESEEPHQHWSRTLTGSEDRLEGLLIADMERGQRQRYLHVPFIPLFQSRPSAMCECEVEGNDDVTAELEQIHLYGARLSVRRRGDCSHPVRIRIHLFVTGQQKGARAA